MPPRSELSGKAVPTTRTMSAYADYPAVEIAKIQGTCGGRLLPKGYSFTVATVLVGVILTACCERFIR